MIYTVKIMFDNVTIEQDYIFQYAMDAINTALDDNMDALNNLKGGFSLICKVKDCDIPEIFPGTKDALSKLTIRGENHDLS